MDNDTVSALVETVREQAISPENVTRAGLVAAEVAARGKDSNRPSDNLLKGAKVAATGAAVGTSLSATAGAIVSATTVTLAPAGTATFAGVTFVTAAKTAVLAPAAVVAVASAGPVVVAAAGAATMVGAWWAVKKLWG